MTFEAGLRSNHFFQEPICCSNVWFFVLKKQIIFAGYNYLNLLHVVNPSFFVIDIFLLLHF